MTRKKAVLINVRFVGSFRGASGASELQLEFETGVIVKQLVAALVRRFSALKSDLIDPVSGEMRKNMLVLINGREIGLLKGGETKVADGDEVVFVPVVHGG